MKKTLYVSDLDGTLLNSQSKISSETAEIINSLVGRGLNFTYATGRSLSSAEPVTERLTKNLPVIVYNGTFIIIPKTGEKLLQVGFSSDEKRQIREILMADMVFPVVYAIVDGVERASWLAGKATAGVKAYVDDRMSNNKTAGRMRRCEDEEEYYRGDSFYFTCIAEKREDLQKSAEDITRLPFCNTNLQKYGNETGFWFEIMPKSATKANAVTALKEKLGCERVVTFGDLLNDMSMFNIADESYAVENAAEELKKIATGIIGTNDSDAVAHWLAENAEF